jgi:cysteinyl-tRNA synthetase
MEYYQYLYQGLTYMTSILGLKVDLEAMSQEDKEIYHDWQKARKEKDFEKADKLRDALTERGIL